MTLDCFRNSCHRPLACPSIRPSCGGRNRTCEGALNRRLPVPTQAPPQCCQSSVVSRQLRSRHCFVPSQQRTTDHGRLTKKHPAGVEPAHPPWQGSRQPLHHGCQKETHRIVKDRSRETSGHREGVEPSFSHYGCDVVAAGPPVHFVLSFSGIRGARTLTWPGKNRQCCR